MDLNKPKPFTPNKNRLAKDWQIWKDEFIVYLRLTDAYAKISEEQRALLLINLMGTKAFEAMEQMSFENPNDKRDMDILLIKFDEFFNPPLNIVQERYKFFSRRKGPNEDVDEYVMDLTEKASKCNFGNQSEKFIVDLLILSMDTYLRKTIWALKLESLSEIIQYYKQNTINEAKMKEFMEDMEPTSETGNEQAQGYELPNSFSNRPFSANRVCSKCGMNHPYKECPAFEEICQNCFSKGHYTSRCKSKESFHKNAHSSKTDKNNDVAQSSSKRSEPSVFFKTSNVQQNQKQTPKVNQMQDCLWCGFSHMQGQCHHHPNCKSCSRFPHIVCFECKKNPHDRSCSKKNHNITQANKIKSCEKCEKNHEGTSCKYCCYCQKYGHWDSECVRKYNESCVQTSERESTQPRERTQTHGSGRVRANQGRNNSRSSNNRKNKDEQDSCCIS